MPPENTAPLLVVALNAPPAPFVPEQHRLAPGYALLVVRGTDPCRMPAVVRVHHPIPYTALQQIFDDSAFRGESEPTRKRSTSNAGLIRTPQGFQADRHTPLVGAKPHPPSMPPGEGLWELNYL